MRFFIGLLSADIPSDTDILEKTDKILNSAEFKSGWDYVIEKIGEFFEWLFGNFSLDYNPGISEVVYFIIIALFIAAALVAIALILRRIRIRKFSHKKVPSIDLPDNYLENSLNSANGQNYSDAIFWLYMHILDLLGKNKYIRVNDSKINSQYILEACNSGFLYWQDFREAAILTSAIRYGNYKASADEYAALALKVQNWRFEAAA